MRAAFLTLGCKVNSYETEAVWELMEKDGYVRVDFKAESDVYVINTCSVTNTGDQKSRQMIRQAIKTNPQAIVVVMGCFSQLKGEEVLAISGVHIVLGTNHRLMIPAYIQEYRLSHTPMNKVSALTKEEVYEELKIDAFVGHHRAFLKIQDGCDNYCSFCIIPYARGRVRSKNPQTALAEARALVASGHEELILTGIHTGGYGLDFEHYDFGDLLLDLMDIEGLKQLRISSIEINELTDKVIEIIRNSKRIVNHLHIPLQSGSERILKSMNRKYTKADYLAKISALRLAIPNLSITTDVIVGFPSETDDDFLEMVQFIRDCQFSELHVFPFSSRSGTVAAKMDNQVDGSLKKARVATLLALSDELAQTYWQANQGMILPMIPETWSDGWLFGHTANYIRVKYQGQASDIGKLVNVRLITSNYPLATAVKA